MKIPEMYNPCQGRGLDNHALWFKNHFVNLMQIIPNITKKPSDKARITLKKKN